LSTGATASASSVDEWSGRWESNPRPKLVAIRSFEVGGKPKSIAWIPRRSTGLFWVRTWWQTSHCWTVGPHIPLSQFIPIRSQPCPNHPEPAERRL